MKPLDPIWEAGPLVKFLYLVSEVVRPMDNPSLATHGLKNNLVNYIYQSRPALARFDGKQ